MPNNLYKINQAQIGLNIVQTIIATTPEGKLLHIPLDNDNMDYQKFLKDVKEHGTDIVEGPDIIEDSYVELRKKEYPSWPDQLDKMYHDFDGWKNDIQTIKNKYPKSITGGTSIGPVPDWIQTEVDNLNSLDYNPLI